MADGVRRTEELRRVVALPRRTPEDFASLAEELTELLKTPAGTMRLRPVQALALHDIGTNGGAFLPIGVGEGKTLIFLLASYMLDAKVVLGLLPASLIEKTKREMKELSKHWLIPTNVPLMSYDMLGRVQSAKSIEEWDPDTILADEVHRLKNLHAACTKRVARFMAAKPKTRFVGMSGTIMRDSIHDFSHLLFWALKDKAPLPMVPHELNDWALALDEPKKPRFGEDYASLEPGALLDLCSTEELREQPVIAARRGFRRRLVETPGVVASAGDGEAVGASIYVTAKRYDVSPLTEQHFATLRDTWERPDGKVLEQGVDVWRHARELAAGMHYRWDPEPPEPWMLARKAWGKYVRAKLARSHTFDSPEQVVQALDAGIIEDEDGLEALAKWRAVKETFRPNTVPVWHDDSVLELAAKWGKEPGIIWTEHGFFGRRLAKETGLPYFGAKGLSAAGEYIEDSSSKTIIASISANKDGKNLQHKWWRNLIVCPPDGWDEWQQAIARTHRPGQLRDEVIVDAMLGCREHLAAWAKAMAGTYAARDTLGAVPKLLLADVDFPGEHVTAAWRGSRW